MPHPELEARQYQCMFANGMSVMFLVIGTLREHAESKRSELPENLCYYLDLVYHTSKPVSWFPLHRVRGIQKGQTYYSLRKDEICVAKKNHIV